MPPSRLAGLMVGLALPAMTMLSGCVAVPCAGNPGATCYQAVQAPPPGYVAGPVYQTPYVPPPYGGQPVGTYVGPDGLTYVNGVPYYNFDGAQTEVVFEPSFGWGWYDGYHHWHGAPRDFAARMDRFHPGGRDFGRGGFGPGRDFGRGGFAPGFAGDRARPGFGPGGFRPGAGAPSGFRPLMPANAPRPVARETAHPACRVGQKC